MLYKNCTRQVFVIFNYNYILPIIEKYWMVEIYNFLLKNNDVVIKYPCFMGKQV